MRDPLPHVLVVDDDASIREALGAALGRAYDVMSTCGRVRYSSGIRTKLLDENVTEDRVKERSFA